MGQPWESLYRSRPPLCFQLRGTEGCPFTLVELTTDQVKATFPEADLVVDHRCVLIAIVDLEPPAYWTEPRDMSFEGLLHYIKSGREISAILVSDNQDSCMVLRGKEGPATAPHSG